MQGYTIRKHTDGGLIGPYGEAALRALVLAGKLHPTDLALTNQGELPLLDLPFLQSVWQKRSNAEIARVKQAKRQASKERGRVVFFQGGKIVPPGPNPTYAGGLDRTPPLKLLSHFLLAQLTGRFHFRSGRHTVDLFLEQGAPVYAASNRMETRLGQLALSEGMIARQTLNDVLEKAKQLNRPLAQALQISGHLTEEQCYTLFQKQIEQRLFPIFSWKTGIYRFYQKQTTGTEFPFLPDPCELYKEAAFRHIPLGWIYEMMTPHRHKRMVRLKNERLKLKSLHLPSGHLALYKNITGDDPLTDVIGRSIEVGFASEEEGYRLCYLLHQLRLLEFREEIVGNRTQKQLEEIDTLIARLKRQSSTERLGLRHHATSHDIRQAYLNLAKRYHPDQMSPGTHPDVAKKMEEAFALIAEAYRILFKSD